MEYVQLLMGIVMKVQVFQFSIDFKELLILKKKTTLLGESKNVIAIWNIK